MSFMRQSLEALFFQQSDDIIQERNSTLTPMEKGMHITSFVQNSETITNLVLCHRKQNDSLP